MPVELLKVAVVPPRVQAVGAWGVVVLLGEARASAKDRETGTALGADRADEEQVGSSD